MANQNNVLSMTLHCLVYIFNEKMSKLHPCTQYKVVANSRQLLLLRSCFAMLNYVVHMSLPFGTPNLLRNDNNSIDFPTRRT
jgi:hypothetical protein